VRVVPSIIRSDKGSTYNYRFDKDKLIIVIGRERNLRLRLFELSPGKASVAEGAIKVCNVFRETVI